MTKDMWNTKTMQQDFSVDWANVKRKDAGLMDIIDFFFSSRRRHTNVRRDWSSDVCSSDLLVRSSRIGLPRRIVRVKMAGCPPTDSFTPPPNTVPAGRCYAVLWQWRRRLAVNRRCVCPLIRSNSFWKKGPHNAILQRRILNLTIGHCTDTTVGEAAVHRRQVPRFCSDVGPFR